MSSEAEPPAIAPLVTLPENGTIDASADLDRRGSSPPPPGTQLSGASSSASDAGFVSTLDLVLNDLAEPAQLLYDDQRHDEWDFDQIDIGQVNLAPALKKIWRAKDRAKGGRRPPSPSRVLLRDKVAFVLGCTQLWLIAWWLGWRPATFYQLYTSETVLLLAVRWGVYRFQRKHYYMLDFCYWANALLLAHCWLAPHSQLLSKVTFAYNTGPLVWSVLAFRNALVFHDLEKVTTVYMHMVPAAVSWTLRWHRDQSRFGPPAGAPAAASDAWESAGFRDIVLLPLLPYMAWASAYWLKIFVISANKIKSRGYKTLFGWVTSRKRGAFYAIAKRVPEAHRPLVYLACHLLFCMCTFVVSLVAWRSYYAHTVLLAVMGLVSLWHGAGIYFSYLAKSVASETSRKEESADAKAASDSSKPAGAAATPFSNAAAHGHERQD